MLIKVVIALLTSLGDVFLLEEKMKQLDAKYNFKKIEEGRYDRWKKGK